MGGTLPQRVSTNNCMYGTKQISVWHQGFGLEICWPIRGYTRPVVATYLPWG